ncbi:hypothetical protein HNR17_000843 [Galbitalea soli]|nr:hypothetical protein [Galbitalea soli]
MTWAELQVIDHANDVLLDDCLRKSGFTNPLRTLDRSAIPVAEDRRYGIWVAVNARRYAYELPSFAFAVKGDALLRAQSAAWSSAEDSCLRSTPLLPELTYTDSRAGLQGSPIKTGTDGAAAAYLAASRTKAWRIARQQWWACLRMHKVSPRTNATDWSPVLPTNPAAAPRTAMIDVNCKASTKIIQTLADIEARYQAAFIAHHREQLEFERRAVADAVREAKRVIAAG